MATKTRNPTGDGTFSGTWTGAAGSRWQSVDDHPDSGGADKLTHGTTAGRSTFTFTAFDVEAGSTITNVQVVYYDQKTGSQGASWGAFLRVNGADRATNDAHNPANVTWTLRTATYATNPATSAAWTVDDVNGTGSNPLQGFGTIATDASPTCELASIQLVVNYTIPGVSVSSPVDNSTVSESAAVRFMLPSVGTDTLTTAESANVGIVLSALAAESITVADENPSLQFGGGDVQPSPAVNDPCTVSELVSVSLPLAAALPDSITIQEMATVQMLLGIRVDDSITLGDWFHGSLPYLQIIRTHGRQFLAAFRRKRGRVIE